MNHSHNNNQHQNSNHDSKHMGWMMAGCILLPVLLLLFNGRITAFNVGKNWLWLVFIILCVGMHVFMMFGHKKHREEQSPKKTETDGDDNQQAKHGHS